MHRTLAAVLLLAAAPVATAAGMGGGFVPAEDAAAAVDRAVAAHLAAEGVTPAPPAADDDFLRRVTLDIAGRLPTRAERAAFDIDWDDARYAAAVDRLLNTRDYAENWAFYWKEVVFRRATDPRSRRAEGTFQDWLADALDEGRGWDAVATDIITATGPVSPGGDGEPNGATGLIAAQGGSGTEVAAEASRIFLGVQLQCAECHDHPYDRWRREEFHQLAAYFPRIRLRRTNQGAKGPASFEVVADDRGAGDADQLQQRVARLRTALVRRFRGVDRNGDGGLDLAELKRTPAGPRADRVLRLGDTDGDGTLSREEAAGLKLPPQVLANAGKNGEHLMPDLEHPERPGTPVAPAFFLTSEASPAGTPDAARRSAAAGLITGSPWFARAAVNRVWAEMTGDGFYAPVDDIGPDRSALAEPALDALAEGFAASGHDLRWLIRAVALTETYQRALDADAPAFAAAKPARLRANQIYHSFAHVAGLGDAAAGEAAFARAVTRGRRGRGATQSVSYDRGRTGNGLERLLTEAFGADPSTAREDLTGDVPQALLMMNGPLSGRLSQGWGDAPLGRLLRAYPAPADDSAAVHDLYDVILVRPPTPAEEAVALDHLDAAGPAGRRAAFEDLAWALLNGAEFLTKR